MRFSIYGYNLGFAIASQTDPWGRVLFGAPDGCIVLIGRFLITRRLVASLRKRPIALVIHPVLGFDSTI
jgi:hypothetical protein